MSELTLDEAKAYLKKESGGANLYDHLSEVLLKILIEKPENSCEAFENISSAVKQARLENSNNNDPSCLLASSNAKSSQEKWSDASLALLKPTDEDEPPQPASGVSDLMDEANMFEWAGIGFSRGETYRLSLAIQKLATTYQTTSMRLWGKYLGAGASYYIAEGLLPEDFEPEDPSIQEGSGGVNKFTYWAMKDDGTYEWVQLPNVTQEQILIARKLKRFVRNDLEGKVLGNPPFPGVEKEFLRAQIARINASTVLCPSGFFQVTEDGDIEPPEEVEGKSAEELGDSSGWVHYMKEINAAYGRCTAMPPREGEDGEELPWEGEEFADRLKSVAEDVDGTWRFERVPSHVFPAVGELAVVKSLLWPGAVTVGLGKKFLNIYVGYGFKLAKGGFQPELPGALQKEFGVGLDENASEGKEDSLMFVNLEEQPDVLDDPTPPEEGEDE